MMAPDSSFSSAHFLSLPKKQQNELIYSLLYPLARLVAIHRYRLDSKEAVRYDLDKEVDWLRVKKNQVERKLAEMEKSICDAESAFESVPRTPSDISQNMKNKSRNNLFTYGQPVKSTKTRFKVF